MEQEKTLQFEKYHRYCVARPLWGFCYGGMVYGFYPSKACLFERCRISVASSKKGGGKKLMLNKLTRVQRQALIASGVAFIVCTEKYLEEQKIAYGLPNLGCAFEQVISLQNGGGLYVKGDKRGFWECGDVVINGEQVQVKFEACSLSEYKTIEKAERIVEGLA